METRKEKPSLTPDGLGAVAEGAVRDRFWVWAHEAAVYNGHYGLPRDSRITPVEGAHYLGVPNVILIRYEGLPPVENDAQYIVPFRSLKRVMWSLTGAGGATSPGDRNSALALAAREPIIAGFFMDDFFHEGQSIAPKVWLADNQAAFPVTLTIRLARPTAASRIELTQTSWATGDYRTGRFAVDVSPDGASWKEAHLGEMTDEPGAKTTATLSGQDIQAVRVRILSTHDTADAFSCGLSRVRLLDRQGSELSLDGAKAAASSTFPGHGAENVLSGVPSEAEQEVGSLSVADLRALRGRMREIGRPLKIGVTLYAHQLTPEVVAHLDLCDVVSLWTWKSADLKDLEASLAKVEKLAPGKELLLGCYMWDFGENRAMPLERMRRQCELGLKWLHEGRISGMIFLATNICDLNLETVEWTRHWIAQVGEERL